MEGKDDDYGRSLALVLVHPAASQAATRISGSADYDTAKCSGPPAAYADFDTYPGSRSREPRRLPLGDPYAAFRTRVCVHIEA